MRISVINLSSDSSDNEDVNEKNVDNHKKNSCEKKWQKSEFYKNQKSVSEQQVPLFKIIFRDESISRMYRKKLEDIIKYLMAEKLDENSQSNCSDLILEIFDPNDNSIIKTTSDSVAELTPKIECHYDKEIKIKSFAKDKDYNKNCLLPILIDQTQEPSFTPDILTWYIQPQDVQKSTFESEFSSSVNLNTRKRKCEDDSDSSILSKKKKVDCASECTSKLQNKSNIIAKKTPYYAPIWFDSSNLQSTINESSDNFYSDPVLWSSSNIGNSAIETPPVQKTEDFPEAQTTNDTLMIETLSLTYRVLKVGTFDYVQQRPVTISKKSIQLCAHHTSDTDTLVKVNIKMANIIKIEASFSADLPALFIHVNENAAKIVKEAFGISKEFTSYLDSESTDYDCNKIIVLPDSMTENCKVIKNLINDGLIKKLDKESADNILRDSFSKVLRKPNLQTKKFVKNLFLHISSYNIRIGTYKCSNRKLEIYITPNGFQFHVPKVVGDNIFKKIIVHFTEIGKLYFSLTKISALFIHVNSLCAQRIRSLLEMSVADKQKLYFDPMSETIAERRLVIVFNKLKLNQQKILKSLLLHTDSAQLSVDKITRQMLSNHM